MCAKWAKNYRIRIGEVSDERESNPSRVPALEASMRAYADKKAGTIVDPVLGTSFDLVEEPYAFYIFTHGILGFGVRYAKSRLNVHRKKCIQKIVCVCAVSSGTLISNSRTEFLCIRFPEEAIAEEEKFMNGFTLILAQGKPLQSNSRSTLCGCTAMMRVLRSDDKGLRAGTFANTGQSTTIDFLSTTI